MSKFHRESDIDRYKLHEELVEQPQKYYDWAVKAARASEEREIAKHDLEVVKANTEKRIRRNPHKYGIDDPKESAIKLEVTRHPKVKRYQRKLIKAIYNEKVMNDAKTSFGQRKSMLQSLVNLNLQLHFAEVPVPQELKEPYYRSRKKNIQHGLKRKKKIKRRKL